MMMRTRRKEREVQGGVQEATLSRASCADAVEASMASAAIAEVKCMFEGFW